MGIIIDIIIVSIFLICIGIGYVKGLTGSLLKIVSFVLALVVAFILFKPIANFVIDHTQWDENLEHTIKEMLIEETEETKEQQEETARNVKCNDAVY